MPGKILLGFSVPDGKPIFIHEHHLFISGMTRLSGKTTTLEALVARSGKQAITFRTKRGEIGFDKAKRILPFYVEKTDWRYVEDLIEATMKEKVRFERSWVIRACKGAHSLAQIQSNVRSFLKREKLRELDRNIFTNIDAYLDIVVPQIEDIKPSDRLELANGVNVMDIVGLTVEMQSLIIRATLEQVLTKMENVIVVLPEAWKFAPQTLGNPVKRTAEHFIREGGAIGNYLWIDSQDLVGIDKRILRSVDIWILGRQKESHEIDAVLDAIPLPKREKPKPEEIQTLPIGHFLAVIGDDVFRVYVQPEWLEESVAKEIAMGKRNVEDATMKRPVHEIAPELRTAVSGEFDRFSNELRDLRNYVTERFNQMPQPKVDLSPLIKRLSALEDKFGAIEQQAVFANAHKEAYAERSSSGESPEIEVIHEQPRTKLIHLLKKLEFDTTSLTGQVMLIYSENFFEKPRSRKEVGGALATHGWPIQTKAYASLQGVLDRMCQWDYLKAVTESGLMQNKLPPNEAIQVTVKEEE